MTPRSTSPRLSPALAELARTLREMQDRINRIERGQRTHQLDFFTVENGSIQTTDAAGNIRSVIGAQPDGTFAHTLFNGPAPLAPSAPVVSGGINSLSVTWDGTMSDGSAPLADFAFCEVHIGTTPTFQPASSNIAGHLYHAGTFTPSGLTAGTTYYVALVAVNTSGVPSTPSTYSAATPASVVGSIPAGSISPTQMAFTARDIGGITTFVQPTPPLSPQIGDHWYDSSNGFVLNVWNGTVWVPYQWGTNSIQAGSITAQLIAAQAVTAAQIAAGTVVAGIVDGTTIMGANLILDGTNGQELVYSGTPASGNLIASIAAQTGTDSLGNSYQAGISSYGSGGALSEMLSGSLFLSNSLPTLAGSMSAPSGTSMLRLVSPTQGGLDIQAKLELQSKLQAGAAAPVVVTPDLLLVGLVPPVSSGASLEVQGTIAWGGSTAATIAVLGTDATGYPNMTDASGYTQHFSGSEIAQVGGNTVTGTALTALGTLTVPGGDVETGATHVIHASGFVTTGASAPTSATFTVVWGSTTLASLPVPGGPAANLSGAGWYVDAEINWISTTQAEITLKVGWHTANGVGGSVEYFTVGNVSGLATNAAKNLVLDFQWGSAPGGQSLQSDVCRFGRLC